ncbi:site-specific integrase [Mucilaginibacter sp. BJC16-A38]|uniref:site-specific integrase n=1 Tax=Mucilaginibacter phenanthrenivorans TaxID=1234842 RepID=UPI00215711D8|nr:site-specific integrase [Mucilaginibacter phenanthrenivorans]MCR8557839.1 site-specific integrase [Mucilaginibacter phenanthrenivorans]
MITFSFKLAGESASSAILLELNDGHGQSHHVPTLLRIAKEKWDEQKQRPANIYLKICKKLNKRLDKLRICISTYLNSIDWNFEKISLRAIKSRMKEDSSSQGVQYLPESLLSSMDSYIRSRSHLICKSTYKRYIVFFNLLQRFEGNRMRHIMIEHVNSTFVREFLEFCKQESYNNSTAYRTINFIKTVLNHLEKRGVRTFAYELELPKPEKRKPFITLTEDELVKIKRMDIPPTLQAARDWLVISCYTGQRVSDFMEFEKAMIQQVAGQECISFVQKKTQQNVMLPLHPAVQVIKSHNGENFPEKLSAKRYNELIKEVVRLAGIDNLVRVGKRMGFRVSTEMIPKWQAVTSHIGRRSFASNFYGKIPTALLMEATGHSSEQMFHRYINHVDIERICSLRLYFEQTYKSKFAT